MSNRRVAFVLILAGVVAGLTNLTMNVASGWIADSWKPYAGLVWVLMFLLFVAGIGLSVWLSRAERPTGPGSHHITQVTAARDVHINYHVIYETIGRDYPALQEYAYDFTGQIERVTRWFVGRARLFERLEAFLDQSACGYLRIMADAGLGKTALAAEVARRYGGLPFFFDASVGITRHDQCLNHLTAGLIARYGLDHDHLPRQAGEHDSGFFQQCLSEAAATGQGVLLVIDALDEADPPLAGANCAYLPPHLPSGVHVVVTQRPGAYLVSTDADTPMQELVITWDDPWQQEDIEAHLQQQAERPDINQSLQAARPQVKVKRFVAALREASQGNFKYLDYVLRDIADRQPGFDPLQMERLPRGLEGYYEQFWARMECVREQEGWLEWNALYRPVIELLGAAGEPVTGEWLAALCGRKPDEVHYQALRRWRRFLSCKRRDGRQAWRIVHRSFADFLARKVDVPAAHGRIAAYYLADQARWHGDTNYAMRWLCVHLSEAGNAEGLLDLVEDAAWYTASREYDPSRRTYA